MSNREGNIPIHGPRNGDMTKSIVDGPRRAGGQISAMVPPPTLNAGLPNMPAKKRQMAIPAIVGDRAEPIKNSTERGILKR
jgi:hypothetical protein